MPCENPSASRRPLWIALILLIASCALFLTLNVHGSWDFVLQRRGTTLAGLLLAAYAVGVSTLLFQTLTNNPILTPAILGFDSLYIFLQTLLVVLLGGVGYAALPAGGKFALELAAMMGGSLLLFNVLLRQGGRDLARMILIGVIFGVFFRSLSSLLKRLLDPEEFTAALSNSFANFNTINAKLLAVGFVIMAASAVFICVGFASGTGICASIRYTTIIPTTMARRFCISLFFSDRKIILQFMF